MSKQCAMNAMGAIFQLVQNDDKADMGNLNTSNLREVVAQCASLKLNASAMPREVYFQLRNKQIGGQWCKVVEMGIGNEHSEELTEDELEEIIDQNTQIAAANFAAWANRANNTDSR